MPVVAAVDQSERAESVLERARDLADHYGVGLHVVHVGSSLTRETVPTQEVYHDIGEKDDPVAEATRIATEIAGDLAGREDVETVGLIGEPAEAIIEYSADHDAEYIVVSGRKRSALGQVLFGSVTQSLLLHADRPVVAAVHGSK